MKLPMGYEFSGIYTGVKKNPNKKDLALIVSSVPAVGVGMFTTNRVCAAPVQVTRERLPSTSVRAILVNSGNANACTGTQGLADAREMTSVVAQKLGVRSEDVLVCSTGIIGRPLPMNKIEEGIGPLIDQKGRSVSCFEAAANGILTTDTRIKTSVRSLTSDSGVVTVAGFAKGAAMIGPNMATMLAFIVTDAEAPPEKLQSTLKDAVDNSFHSISVEGHTSTNDTVLLLANGESGVPFEQCEFALATAIEEVCAELAVAIIDDAEEVTHRMTIDVVGTRTNADARRIAKAVADSPLVKTAIFGNDPNWGRICSAAGYAGVEFSEKDLSLQVNDTLLYERGIPTTFDKAAESARMKASFEVKIVLSLTLGEGKCRFWSSDLSTGYVTFNAEYTT